MTENQTPPAPDQPVPAPFDAPAAAVPAAAAPAAAAPASAPASAPAPVSYGAPAPMAPITTGGPTGKIRGTGITLLLSIVTFGIYTIFWYYSVHEEMKRHTGRGLGGVVAALLALFVGIVMPFITSSEAGGLYEAQGRQKPVSGATGLWFFPGIFILIGPLVWFIKTNGAINEYWRSQGVQG